eukprot:CAMPEP_0196596372 /NCGR_PEP_ID=MMETSP1081-20130531/85675_1 /TAXON_ID=36882 /ORGANISM="Pyramimonas amylifera, Strain CCMP720" /LENGTH=132 /DNA_ID=CAMNT_0041921339 /DNA_START=791 /DNA_END=1185 /DNA_ORIENTATION=-
MRKEIAVLGGISHPNLVQMLGWCPEEKCIVYELCEQGHLADHMPNLSYLARLRAATEVARALAFLHGLPPPSGPVVHRDLKPSNILLNPDGIAKVADVGLAFMMSDITSDSDTMEQEPEVRSCMLEKELVGT